MVLGKRSKLNGECKVLNLFTQRIVCYKGSIEVYKANFKMRPFVFWDHETFSLFERDYDVREKRIGVSGQKQKRQ